MNPLRTFVAWAFVVTAVTVNHAGVAAAAAGDADDVGGFTSRAALQANGAHQKKAEAAEREYRRAMAAADAEYAAELEKAKAQATAAGDLDEAIRIRDAAARVKEQAALARPGAPDRSARAKLTVSLVNTTWATPAFPFHLGSDDKFTAGGSNGSGRWLAVDGKRVVLLFDNGWLNVLTFDEALSACTAAEAQPKAGWKGKRSKRD